ncbi:hypothetical protein KIH41_17045 [Litoribacter ruber]|uniref:hypothetical protein n=1 Tax=Litoribacter ruber TaxID=702568 RepID=UPI001BD91A80|nr:hypothetical protein [Litoribacter ruber]MBT0812997.1 hypothetical protein [Litoribacter ruber]
MITNSQAKQFSITRKDTRSSTLINMIAESPTQRHKVAYSLFTLCKPSIIR